MAGYQYHRVNEPSFEIGGPSLKIDRSIERASQEDLLSKLKEFLPNKEYTHPSVSNSKEFRLSSDSLSKTLSQNYLPPLSDTTTRYDSMDKLGNDQNFSQDPKPEKNFPSPEQTGTFHEGGFELLPKPDGADPITTFSLEPTFSVEDISEEIFQTYIPPLISSPVQGSRHESRRKNIVDNGREFQRATQVENKFSFDNFDSFQNSLKTPLETKSKNNPATSNGNEKIRTDKFKPKVAFNDPFFIPTVRLDGEEVEVSREFFDSLEDKTFIPKLKAPHIERPSFNEFPFSKLIHHFEEVNSESRDAKRTPNNFGRRTGKKNSSKNLAKDDSNLSLDSELEDFQSEFVKFHDLRNGFPNLIEGNNFSHNISDYSKVDNKTAALIFVLLGSLSPVLRLSNHSIPSHLTNYLNQDISDISASVIHIPGLNTERHFQERKDIEFLPKSLARTFSEALVQSNQEACNQKYFSFECRNYKDGFCLEDPKYPLSDVKRLIKDDPVLFSKYAEVKNQSADDLVAFLEKKQDDHFDYSKFNPSSYDESHWFGPEGYICPSNVTYGLPMRAKNSEGNWKYILNDGDQFSQTLRIESCLYTNTPCRLVAPCFKSECVQKYSYHRLLSYDPCQPAEDLRIDIFRLPSSCSCYAPEFRGFDDLFTTEVNKEQMVKAAIGK